MAYDLTRLDEDYIGRMEEVLANQKANHQALSRVRDAIDKKLRNSAANIERSEAKLKAAQTKGLKISDHAIVRYFERMLGINVEGLLTEIVPEEHLDTALTFSGNLDVGTHYLVIKNNTLVTVTPKRGDNEYNH